MLTVTNGGAPATGNALSYGAAYRWSSPSSYSLFDLSLSTTACVPITVTELVAGSTFSATTFNNRPQVRTGHSASHAGVV